MMATLRHLAKPKPDKKKRKMIKDRTRKLVHNYNLVSSSHPSHMYLNASYNHEDYNSSYVQSLYRQRASFGALKREKSCSTLKP